MTRHVAGIILSLFLCLLCALLASKNDHYTLYDVGGYVFASTGMGCVLALLDSH